MRSLRMPKINICRPNIVNRAVRTESGTRVIPWNHWDITKAPEIRPARIKKEPMIPK